MNFMAKINQPSNLWGSQAIGDGTTIGAFADIGDGVSIGFNCKIQCHVSIPPGVLIGDNVFIGPGTVFTNDKNFNMKREFGETIVESGAMIGANCTIGSGIKIGKNSIIGMGSVVTKSVPQGETWYGNPAKKENG